MFFISLIGFGKWGKILYENIILLHNIKVNDICKKNYTIDNKYSHLRNILITDYREIIKRNNDAVIIAINPKLNHELVEFYLNNNINIFLEKPLCLNYEIAKKIVNLSVIKKKVLHVNYIHLYNENFEKIKKILANEETKYISIILGNNGPIRDDFSPIYDWGPHVLSLLIELTSSENIKINKLKRFNSDNAQKFNVLINGRVRKNISYKILFGNFLKQRKFKINIITNSKQIQFYDDFFIVKKYNNRKKYNFKTNSLKNSLNKFFKKISFNDYKNNSQLLKIYEYLDLIENNEKI